MKRLSLKQKRFAQEYIKNGGNATQAAWAVYDGNYKTAKVTGYQNLRKPHIKAYLEFLLDEAGLSDEAVAQGLSNLVKEGIASGTATTSDAIRAIDMVFRLKGRYPSHKVEATHRNVGSRLNSMTSEELLHELTHTTEENKKLLVDILQ